MSVGQTDIAGASLQARARKGRSEAVPIGCIGEGYGVVFSFRPITPTIKDAEHDGARRPRPFGRIGHAFNIGGNDKIETL